MQLEAGVGTKHSASLERQDEPAPTPLPGAGRGLLLVLSAPSGTGKDTVISALRQQGQDFYVVPSVTTRKPRVGESEGNPYNFISQEQFDQMVVGNELLEHAKVHGNWYGQPKQFIRDNLKIGRDVLLKIDVQGAATIRCIVPQAIFIFLVPGSVEELVQRLLSRQTETETERERRLADAQMELAQRDLYDYVVVNQQGKLQEAVNLLRAIIMAEHARTHPRIIEL